MQNKENGKNLVYKYTGSLSKMMAADWTAGVRFTTEDRFSVCCRILTGSGTHLGIHLSVVPALQMLGALPSLPLYAFMA
jgi:hypothetical protein